MKFASGTAKRNRATALLSGVAAVGILIAACGSSSDGGTQGSSSSADIAAAKASAEAAEKAPTELSASTPLSKKAPTGKLVVFLKDPTAPSLEVQAGLEEAAAAIGWTVKSVKFDPSNISTLNTGLLQALSMGADYVVDSGFPEAVLSKSTVSKFKDAGVPIIVSGATPVPATGTLVGSYSDENSRILAGQQLGDWFIADSKGAGKSLIVNITTYATLTLFATSFADHVKEKCSGCDTNTLSVTFEDAITGKLATNVISKLRADRSIKYVTFDNSGEIVGIDAALKAAGLNDVKVIGHSMDPVTVKSLKSGQAEAFVAYNFRFAGWDSIDLAARHSVGDETSFPKASTPIQLITKKTVDQVPANALFRGPENALEQYKRLWLVQGS